MDRTVPYTASEEVELYMRTYYSLLRSTSDVQIKSLEEVHSGMNSLLHSGARDLAPDMSAFIYNLFRLPDCIKKTKIIVMGQSTEVFSRAGVGNVESWTPVSSRARRRRCFFNGKDTLACIIASRSDIDDIIPLVTAYQIEWNKLHRLLNLLPLSLSFDGRDFDQDKCSELASVLKISLEDIKKLAAIWGEDFIPNINAIATSPQRFRIQLLSSSLSEYRRATHGWWKHIEQFCCGLVDRPIYFVSSNLHSLVNLLSGYALKHRSLLVEFLENSDDGDLIREWVDIQAHTIPSSQENFLYYVLKKFLQSKGGGKYREERLEFESESGITRIDSEHFFEVDAQVIELSGLKPEYMDPRLCEADLSMLKHSDAVILNIDYPLGMAAYNILSKVSEHAGGIIGIYIMGKAATLNGVIGDVLIPNLVHDEHSRNSYLFANAFLASDVAPYLVYGTVLDNQKAVSVRGTYLQNAKYMDVFYKEGYTDIEMESGPYLSAVYEMMRPKRHPVDEIVNLYNAPFDLGILHYASDTPLSKGKNLGAGTLSYFGMDPTYATSLAILRQILRVERIRLSNETGS